MDSKNNWHFDTQCLHSGQEIDENFRARAVPIYQTTSFLFNSTQQAADLFNLKESGHIYTRLSNPTTQVVEERLASLEGGIGAVLTASGLAAEMITFATLARQGENIISARNLYGGTKTMLSAALPRFGITAKFADVNHPNSFIRLIDDKSRAVYVETISNPSGDIPDFEIFAKLAHDHGLPLIVDNTFASPFLCRPIKWGADIIIHSATKFIGGHGTSLGGVIIDSGHFPWDSGRFAEFTQPSSGYHGLNFWETFKHEAFIKKCRFEGLRTLGPAPSPFNAFLFLQGLETLHLRVPRHNFNAHKIAHFLKNHPKIDWVTYAGLPDHPSHKLAEKYFSSGYGSIFTFGVKGGITAGKKFIENLRLISHLANVGDAKTLIVHPASTSHSQLTEQERIEAGITPDLIRLSIGLEHVSDLTADLSQALAEI